MTSTFNMDNDDNKTPDTTNNKHTNTEISYVINQTQWQQGK